MRLEALELVEGRQVRVLVVEADHEADATPAVLQVIQERAAVGLRIERPALAVDDEALVVLVRRDLPQFLDADAVVLRIDAVAQVELLHQLLRERPAAAFGEQRVLRVQLHAGLVARALCEPSRATPMSPVATPLTAPCSSYSTSAAAKPAIDLHAQRLGLLRRASGTRCPDSRCSCRDCCISGGSSQFGARYALSRSG